MLLVAILLLIVFGSLVAASLPLLIGGVAIMGAFAILRAIAGWTDVSVYAANVVTMLGLGLAIDYALFMNGPPDTPHFQVGVRRPSLGLHKG